MAFVHNGGVPIFWRENGSGEPLLLVMGFGYTSEMWLHVEPALAARFRVLTFDNRGVGRSGSAPDSFRIEDLAADAAAVLAAAGIERAHVFGASMGGYIAQELALSHPERVRSLVLGCTSCGGRHAIPAGREVLEAFEKRKELPPEQGIHVMVPYIYDAATPAERIEADLAIRLRTYPSAAASAAQLEAVLAWESHDRLGDLRVPTLVIHGENDRLIPPENGRVLAERIPGARLVVLPNASHLFFTDQPQATVDAVVRFVSAGAA